jgi:putative polyketide hydroxylase
MTPRGGTGMNTAIHDGFDLGWKLAWVLRGWAAPSLLDTYERRRRPVGLRNVERSAVEGSTRDASMDYLDDLGGRITHATLPDGRSTLDLVGPGLTLLTGPRGRRFAEATAVLGGCVPVAVHGTDEATAAELGIGPDGAVLVLPDATPVRRWPTAPSDVDDELALIISGQTDRTSALV